MDDSLCVLEVFHTSDEVAMSAVSVLDGEEKGTVDGETDGFWRGFSFPKYSHDYGGCCCGFCASFINGDVSLVDDVVNLKVVGLGDFCEISEFGESGFHA